jgi:tetratricopeptide (TPR) repeat protein
MFWMAFATLIIGLGALNLWWTWEERPLPDLTLVGRWMARGWYDEAEKALRTHLRRSPNDGEARWMLARTLMARNDLDGSLAELKRIPFWCPRKPDALLREGQVAMALGRAREAEEAWGTCVADNPMHPTPPKDFTQAVHELVQLYKWEGRRDQARELLWRAYRLTERADHPTILLMSVWIGLLKTDPADAVEKLKRFVAADRSDYEARRALACAELELGQSSQAKADIEACLAARPHDAHVWRDYLKVLARAGDQSSLEQAFAQMPEATNQYADTWIARGLEREEAGDVAGAGQAYRRAIDTSAFEEDGYYKLALIEKRLGHATEAQTALDHQRALHEARVELHTAYEAYLDASHGPSARGSVIAELSERLAQGCESLGWSREAGAWRKLAASQ